MGASESEAQPEPEPEPESRAGSKTRAYTILEILCVFFWFLLDGFWLLEWKYLTYAFSVIAIATAFTMFRFIKKERVIVLVACADTSWLILNILWAIGDLSKIHEALVAAKFFFLIGGILCLIAFCASEASKRLHVLVLSRLRHLEVLRTNARDLTSKGLAFRRNWQILAESHSYEHAGKASRLHVD